MEIVDKMEQEELRHFSHEEHPLILSQVQNIPTCYGCQKEILEPKAYCCFSCDFFLHKLCAELPRQIRHPLHSQHPLILLHELPPLYVSCICHACGRKDCKNFFYHCSSCFFDLDVSCAIAEQGFEPEISDRRFWHKSHEHQLILQQSQAIVYCDACQLVEKDASYMCTTCPFWIHKNCASLPDSVNHKGHNHSLVLAYSLSYQYRSFRQKCKVCHRRIRRNLWAYYCGPCRFFVHVKCVKVANDHIVDAGSELEDTELLSTQNLVKLPLAHAAQEFITNFLVKAGNESSTSSTTTSTSQFRMRSKSCIVLLHEDEEKGKDKNLLLRAQTIPKSFKEKEMKRRQNEKKMEDMILHFSHKHPLFVFNSLPIPTETEKTEEMLLQCDGCMDPISIAVLHYRCVDCSYFLHAACSKIPPELQIPSHPEHPVILTRRRNAVGHFRCDACRWLGNSLHYRCKTCNFDICIKCASASLSTSILHDAHKHLLTPTKSSDPKECNACGSITRGFAFGCDDCKFYLDYECALLPPTTKRSWDNHQLILMYPPYFDHPDEFYCVKCEKEINPNCWIYHYDGTDKSFHPSCIPQFGVFRNVKFGRTLNVDNHSHPITHIQEAEENSFCAECHRSLNWQVAFECKSCRFCLCLKCAFAKEVQM